VNRRDDVVASLQAAPGFIGAQALYADIRARGARIGLATVYRILQALAAADQVDVVRSDDGEALYRWCRSTGHHHHLLCRCCGRAVELDAEVVEEWARTVADRHGFVAVDHVVEITGTCAACSTADPRPPHYPVDPDRPLPVDP
jgi:Fur family transcriptional regulator, ferric uptake regulator